MERPESLVHLRETRDDEAGQCLDVSPSVYSGETNSGVRQMLEGYGAKGMLSLRHDICEAALDVYHSRNVIQC